MTLFSTNQFSSHQRRSSNEGAKNGVGQSRFPVRASPWKCCTVLYCTRTSANISSNFRNHWEQMAMIQKTIEYEKNFQERFANNFGKHIVSFISIWLKKKHSWWCRVRSPLPIKALLDYSTVQCSVQKSGSVSKKRLQHPAERIFRTLNSTT